MNALLTKLTRFLPGRSTTTKSSFDRQRTLRGLYVMIGILLTYAWFPTGARMISHVAWPGVKPGPLAAYDFIALMYNRDSIPEGLQPGEHFQDHIDSLKSAGYIPIGLTQVHQLLHEGAPLPEKAVLITVDENDPTFYDQLQPVLRREGWTATAFLSSGNEVNETIKLGFVRNLARSRYWEVGARSHFGYVALPGDSGEGQGHYLTSYAWLAELTRFETLDEFRDRIHQDHQASLDQFRKQANCRPRAFGFPYGDFGQFSANSDQVRKVNQLEAARHYTLAFISGDLAVNNRESDPYRLNRMVIPPDLSGRELIKNLRGGSENHLLAGGSEAAAWVHESGQIQVSSGILKLQTRGQAGQALAWYAAEDLGHEFRASLDFYQAQGDLTFYVRYQDAPRTFTRIRLASGGKLQVEIQKPLSTPEILVEESIVVKSDRLNTMEIFMRGDRLYIRINSQNVFGQGIEMAPDKQPCRFGIGLLDVGEGPGLAEIERVKVGHLTPRLVSWNIEELEENYVIEWLHENAGRFSHISPPSAYLQSSEQEVAQLTDTLLMLANIYRMKVFPALRLKQSAELEQWTPEAITDELAALRYDGMYIDFSAMENPDINQLRDWLEECNRQMRQIQKTLLLGFPQEVEVLLSVRRLVQEADHLQIIASTAYRPEEEELEQAAGAEVPIPVELIRPPTPDYQPQARDELYILDQPNAMSEDEVGHRIRMLKLEGEKAFQRGDYEKAIISLSEWHELSPQDSRPMTMIADALYALGYREEALDFYRQSLDIHPGQVKLVARLTEIFSVMKRNEEARNLLNLYVRLFPQDPDILYAQANWLARKQRYEEAQNRIDAILEKRPYDFNALMLMLRIASEPDTRDRAFNRLLELAENEDRHMEILQSIEEYDLLTLPNSGVLVTLMDEIGSRTANPEVVDQVHRLRPRTGGVEEVFRDGKLSADWEVEGGMTIAAKDGLQLVTLPTSTESTVRLLRSERWHDAYIQARVRNANSGFWLYVRRSVDSMIRYGFDSDDGKLYLQIWKGKNTRMETNEQYKLPNTLSDMVLRLEARGNGVIALLNGETIFSIPMEISPDVGHGRVALAIRSPERGNARAVISELEAGPIAPQIAMLPATPAEDQADDELNRIRALLGKVSDCSPEWFKVKADHTWASTIQPSDDFFRLFARYYRLRLVPTVSVAEGADIEAEAIKEMVQLHKLDGLLIHYENTAPAGTFEELQHAFTDTPYYIYLSEAADLDAQAIVKGIGKADLLVGDGLAMQQSPIMDPETYLQFSSSDARVDSPVLIAFPKDGPAAGSE